MYDNVIVVDYDGVCAYWEHGFDMSMIANGYKPITSGHYNIEDKYGITKEKADALILSFNESAALRKLAPFKDAIKYIRKLHEEHGYVFHCISAIPDMRSMYDARMENSQNLFGKTAFERLTLCGSSKNKKELLAEYAGTGCFWVEDLPENAMYGVDHGMRALLLNHHYNKDFVCPENKMFRVQNWKEIYSHVIGENDSMWFPGKT